MNWNCPKCHHKNNITTHCKACNFQGVITKIGDPFSMAHKYNPELIRYSGIDAAATMFVYFESLQYFKEQAND